ncbi:hypothetical protein [Nocardia amikacinitolerans]|uniref:hypothetical protein n=1 Tax=Nocardia amikacinitolerans TaxID=756689 RepID=UPI0020A49838|nr:hypothetical protein [Nocardia amikacinitolerans]
MTRHDESGDDDVLDDAGEICQEEMHEIEQLLSGRYSTFEVSELTDSEDFTDYDVDALISYVTRGGFDWRAAVVELTDRVLVEDDSDAVRGLCRLGKLRQLKEDRLFGYVSLSWYVVSVLYVVGSVGARAAAAEICETLDSDEYANLMQWLGR